ncbi:MAG: laccase domain-containing protein [Phycisphaerales bacterium]|nr:laccase domain-containing protein [Phycisphaerales bacterium]
MMIEATYADLTLLQFENLDQEAGLTHAFTTRPQNYAPHRGMGKDKAIDARRKVCDILGASFDRLTSPAQVHNALILRIEEEDIGRGRDGRDSALPYVDGLVTDRPNLPMILLSADCPLVCVYDPDRPAVGGCHASWLGTVGGITGQLVRRMLTEFGSRPERLRAAITPSAGPCCYEVGHEVRRIARDTISEADTFLIERNGQLFFDLWAANRRQLTDAGLKEGNIETASLCSICDQRFWSHRRDGADAGRSALIVNLR